MKKYLSAILAIASLMVIACKKGPSGNVDELIPSFDINPNPCYAGSEVHFINTTTGGTLPYACTWTIDGVEKNGDEIRYTFTKNGTYTVSLKVKDGSGQEATKRKMVVVDPAPVQKQGKLEILWVAKTQGYNSISVPAVANDGSVYATTKSNILYKFDKNGNQVWANPIVASAPSGCETVGTPSVDVDGTVFMGGGTLGPAGTVKAINPDGSVKWSYSQWWAANGATPSPTYQSATIAVTENNIYFGHCGTNGCVVSANKATGKRNGFLAPAGGARTGVAVSKDGYAAWFGGSWGLHSIKLSSLDNGTADPLTEAWGRWADAADSHYAKNGASGGIAALNVNGTPCFAGMATDSKGTRVYAVKAIDGTDVCECYIEGAAAQDQGGVVVTPEGYIVASLAYTTGQENGGICVVNPSTQKVVAAYNVQEKVSGSAAIDQAGNIHFASESGNYYVVNKNCEILVKAEIAESVNTFAPGKFTDLRQAKIWSSVVMGDDGVVYLQFTDNDDRTVSGVVAFKVKDNSDKIVATAPAATGWPMFGCDRRHTNIQK